MTTLGEPGCFLSEFVHRCLRMPRTIRFRYNQVFLPEYLSTIFISIPISFVFMKSAWGGGPAILVATLHLMVAVALYLGIALWLLALTLIYRMRYTSVKFYRLDDSTTWIETRGRQIRSDHVVQVDQSLGKFFGRLVRKTRIEDDRGNAIQFCDAMFEYDALRMFLGQLLNWDLDQFPHDDPQLVERVQRRWHERHAVFPPSETLGDLLGQLTLRAVCLLPVALSDVLISWATLVFLENFQRQELVVYSAPLSLLTSGFIARFVYYKIFSSTTMNKTRGAETHALESSGEKS
ncbi:MAG: hypothetical protein KDA84_03230 [Planctomycetaceae bacterium]|nr:hypothetical protein [Planctomycetaceae bacterium]